MNLQLTQTKLWYEGDRSKLSDLLARPLAVTERNWFYGLVIVIGSGVLFWTFQIFEESVAQIQPGQRLVENASEASMRFLAQSHFVVAFLFLLRSRRMRTSLSRTYFAGLFAFGLLLCWAFSSLGAMKSPLGVVLFYAYFMIHDFRDQIFFYQANGDAGETKEPKALSKDLMLIPIFFFALVAATFIPAVIFEIGDGRFWVVSLRQVPTLIYWTIMASPIAITILILGFIKRRYDRRDVGGARGFIRKHRPLLTVFLGIYGVLIGGLIVTGRAYSVVNLHVCTWYVFSVYHLSRRPASRFVARPLSWRWMRTTTAGFSFLHIGVAGLLVFAGVVWAYGFYNDSESGLWFLVSRDVMPYWTILHVTTSFLPKK